MTGRRRVRLVAHHIEAYRDNPDLRTVVSNGITMAYDVHIEFHRRYGRGGNTRAQYEEFLASFRLESGEVTDNAC